MKTLELNRASPRIAMALSCACLLSLHGCGGGGGGSSNMSAPTGVVLSGAVVDGPVAGATVAVYALSASGTVLPATTQLPEPIVSTTSSSTGTYTLPALPASFTGPVEVTSSGGTYKDDVTGASVAGPNLSALIPDVAAGTASLSAQLTPLTTLAAQLAIQTAALPGADIKSAATTLNGAIASYFGGQADIVATPLVDVSTANCATAASTASTDYSIVLAGLSYLASNNPSGAQVAVIDLIDAIAQDVGSDGVLDGYASGATISVATAAGGTTTLCAIEGNCLPLTANSSTLAQQIQAKVMAFAASVKNACGVVPSNALLTALASRGAPVNFLYTIGGGFSNIFGGGLVLSINGGTPITIDSNAPFTFPALFANGYTYDVEVTTQPPGQNCTPSSNTGTVASANVTNVSIDCELTGNAYQVSYQVSGLTGSGLILTDGFGLQSPNGSQPAAFVSDLAAGSPYTISVQTQPSDPTQTCTVSSNGTGTVSSTSITNPAQITCIGGQAAGAIYVIDSTNTLFAFDANGAKLAQASLPFGVSNINGGGITTDATNVYVTIGQSSSVFPNGAVLAYDKVTLAPVTLPTGSFSQLATPRGIVYDPHNAEFYVGNGGTTVTVYDASGNFLFSFPRGLSSDAIYGPSGVAFDATHDTIWVANLTGGNGVNPTYGVADFLESGAVAQPPIVPATQFLAPSNPTRELPYAIGYCAGAGAGGTDLVAVGFQADNSGQGGVAEGGIYATTGALVAAFSPQLASTAQPNAISCASNGSIWVAANDGLHVYSAAGAALGLPPNGFSGLVAPIFGVLAGQ